MKFLARRVSRILDPRVMFAIQHWWLRLGNAVFDISMASWVIRRPEWVKHKARRVPAALEPPLPFDGSANTAIARRCVEMHNRIKAAEDPLIPETSMWGVLRQVQYAELCNIVESGDLAAMTHYQSRLFRTDTVNAYTYGTTFDRWPHRWHYLPVQIELSVVTLAESLGLLRAECHEQGEPAFWRNLFSEEQIMDRLEAFFGFRIEQPRHGDPRGIMFGGRFLTRETCSHLYSANRMSQAIKELGELRIVEIGGGFGGTSYWLRKMLGDRITRHAIVDLPEVLMVQALFLGPLENVVLQGEPLSGGSPLQLIPHFKLEEIDFRPNVIINQDSIPEMPESEVVRYLEWASANLEGVFLSFNQETYSPWAGDLQLWAPEIISRYPRFKRLSRETSWDRRGYVEEIYEVI